MSSKCEFIKLLKSELCISDEDVFCFQILQVIHLSKIELKHCAGQNQLKTNVIH